MVVVAVADALDLMHALTLDTGERWGAVATPVQRANAQAVLEPGPRSPRLHWYEAPKGYSKSTDTAGLSLAWLVADAPELAEGYVIAGDLEQANRLLDKARGLVARSRLGGVARVEAHRLVNVRNGARVVALAADAPTAEGLLSPLFIADEVPRWPDTRSARAMWTAVFSSVPKWPGARLVVLGHAGDPAHWSYRLRERARTSRSWRFTRVPGPTPWLATEALAEQRAVLLPSEYARRHENRWTAGEDRLTSREDVAACVGGYDVLEPREGVRYVGGLDVGLTNDRCVVTIAHREADGRVVVDRQHVWQGSRARPVNLGEVEAFLRELHRAYRRCPFRVDPFQAVHLAQRLRADGIQVEEFTFSSQSVGRLAVTLYRLLADRLLVLPADEGLVEELVNVRLRETAPGVFRIDHDAGAHDDRVISLAMVAHRLAERPTSQPGRFSGLLVARTRIADGPAVPSGDRSSLLRDGFSPWRVP
jgi:phage terminase large subunit-like protein